MSTLASTAVHASRAASPWTPLRLAAAGALVLVTLWLGWASWTVNIAVACWKNEWPYLPVCEQLNGRTPQEKVARLEERLAANPGDAQALVALTVYAHQPGVAPHLDPNQLLARAVAAAPQHVDVLRLQAITALQAARWAEALDPLIRLSRYHQDADATRTLAEMVAAATRDETLGRALLDAAKADPGWLDRVLGALPQVKVPTVVAMPLVNEVVAARLLTPRLGLALIRQLRTEGAWLEARALWLQLWNRPLPLVFNGDFEQVMVAGGFDWETIGPNDHRSGAQVSRVGRKGHGQVLKLDFVGKQFNNPVLRQLLLLPPGHYRLSGSWQSTDLRSEQGLAWVMRCEQGQRELARLSSLGTTGRQWVSAEVAFEVPEDCGAALSLALQTQAPYESQTGLRGEMVIDGVQLERVSP